MPRFNSLPAWLAWQETLHPQKIDLGLERVAAVADRMGLRQPDYGVITVAGTNGKGSSVAMLASILGEAGYRVGSYTSPHLLRYNERIRISGHQATDSTLCRAFDRVDQARGQETLSYFEFGTLAALHLFATANPDIALLEVGMGGRLDAVNIIDPDAALVTAIDIDHSAWLGTDREAIGREKAGIFRRGRPAVCSDPSPPASLEKTAIGLGANWRSLGQHFSCEVAGPGWNWQGPGNSYLHLPPPALAGMQQFDNAAGVLMVLESLRDRFPVQREAIEQGLRSVTLPGRFQVLPGAVEVIFDVAHNPASARRLAQTLAETPAAGRTWLVLGMLQDKDVAAFMETLVYTVDHWCLVSLDVERGLPAAELRKKLPAAIDDVHDFPNVTAACRYAHSRAVAGDRVVVCGSFITVAKAMACHV
jgi:dihydrofolate synthase / folylpolyglutamate synthase